MLGMSTDMSQALSPVEDLKAGSDGLRGTLVDSLADPVTGALREGDLVAHRGPHRMVLHGGAGVGEVRDARAVGVHLEDLVVEVHVGLTQACSEELPAVGGEPRVGGFCSLRIVRLLARGLGLGEHTFDGLAT
mgnify:CR=1 FL=1